jgi:hypothetical protein
MVVTRDIIRMIEIGILDFFIFKCMSLATTLFNKKNIRAKLFIFVKHKGQGRNQVVLKRGSRHPSYV